MAQYCLHAFVYQTPSILVLINFLQQADPNPGHPLGGLLRAVHGGDAVRPKGSEEVDLCKICTGPPVIIPGPTVEGLPDEGHQLPFRWLTCSVYNAIILLLASFTPCSPVFLTFFSETHILVPSWYGALVCLCFLWLATTSFRKMAYASYDSLLLIATMYPEWGTCYAFCSAAVVKRGSHG